MSAPSPTKKVPKTASITVKVTPHEKTLAEKLAIYLHKMGKIAQPHVSEAMRLSLHYTAGEIGKAIESQRLGAM